MPPRDEADKDTIENTASPPDASWFGLPLVGAHIYETTTPPSKLAFDNAVLQVLVQLIGSTAILFATFILYSQLAVQSLPLPGQDTTLPAILILIFSVTLFFFALRLFSGFLKTPQGLTTLKFLGVFGLCLAPLGLLTPWWLLSLPCIALGQVSIVLFAFTHLSSLSHTILVSLISVAFVFSVIINSLILPLNISAFATVTIICCSMAVGCLIFYPIRSSRFDSQFLTSNSESKERAIRAKTARWSYLSVSITLGFFFGLILFVDTDSASIETKALLVALAVILASLTLLIIRNAYSFTAENFIIDWTAFALIIGLLPLPFIQGIPRAVCMVYLMLVLFAHLIVIMTVFMEVIRFEQVSPLWYIAEIGLLTLGTGIGFCLVWAGHLYPLGISLASSLIIAFICFSQVFIARSVYPQPIDVSLATPKIGEHTDTDKNGRAFWRQKINSIGTHYKLSPRQKEVFLLLAKGRDATYIAQYFSISNSTAKSHIYSIYTKLGIHSQQNLLDIIDDPDIAQKLG